MRPEGRYIISIILAFPLDIDQEFCMLQRATSQSHKQPHNALLLFYVKYKSKNPKTIYKTANLRITFNTKVAKTYWMNADSFSVTILIDVSH